MENEGRRLVGEKKAKRQHLAETADPSLKAVSPIGCRQLSEKKANQQKMSADEEEAQSAREMERPLR